MVRKKKKKEEDYDELYPDEPKEKGKILTSKDLLGKEEEIEEEEQVKEEKEVLPNIEDIPTTGDTKQDIINRLDGISEIARRANDIVHSEKVIRLSNECKALLEEL